MASRRELEDKSHEIVRILEGNSPLSPEEITGSDHESAAVHVHPGFSDYSGFLEKTLGLNQNDYRDYIVDISENLHESKETGSPAVVLYPQDFREETEEFIGDITEIETAEFIPTYSRISSITGIEADARPVTGYDERGAFSGEARYAGLIDSIRDGGRLEIFGELRTQCYSDAVIIAEKVGEAIEKDFTVEKQSSFPKKKFIPMPIRNISSSLIH